MIDEEVEAAGPLRKNMEEMFEDVMEADLLSELPIGLVRSNITRTLGSSDSTTRKRWQKLI